MQKQIIAPVVGLALWGTAAGAAADSTININIWDAGDDQIGLSWMWSGDLANPEGATVMGEFPGIVAFGLAFGDCISNPGIDTSFMPLTSFGSLGNVTTGASETFNAIQLSPDLYGSGQGGLSFMLGYNSPEAPYTELPTSVGDQIAYTPSLDSITLSVPYSDFNPGTYQMIFPGGAVFNGDTTFNLTVGPEPVPEPATLALAALGGLALLGLRWRR